MKSDATEITIIDINSRNIEKYGFCCVKNKKNEGYLKKHEWLSNRFQEGLKFKMLYSESDGPLGFIEYTPGETTWRSVHAAGFSVINCLYVMKKKDRNLNLGSRLVESCISDAKKEKLPGVAVLTSKSAMLAEKSVFLKNGFELKDKAERFELLIKPFEKKSEHPSFTPFLKKREKMTGWNLVYSHQCPFHQKAADAIKEAAAENGIDLDARELKTYKEAQMAPSPYGVFGLVKDGKLLADHYISKTRFLNILKKDV